MVIEVAVWLALPLSSNPMTMGKKDDDRKTHLNNYAMKTINHCGTFNMQNRNSLDETDDLNEPILDF